jgi:hypothetical protein
LVSLGNSPRLTYTETKKLAQPSQPNRLSGFGKEFACLHRLPSNWPLNQTSGALAIPHRVKAKQDMAKDPNVPEVVREQFFLSCKKKKSRLGLDFGNSS